MKEKIKKLLIVSLAVLMLLTSVPLTGFVGLDIGFTAEAALATSGKCGDNATWKYDAKTQTLTVSGSGPMWDYTVHEPEYMADPDTEIENVVIGKGITRVGSFSIDFVNLTLLSKSVSRGAGISVLEISESFTSTSLRFSGTFSPRETSTSAANL